MQGFAGWFSDQLSAIGDQFLSLILSATIGGLISWLITRKFDEKARREQQAKSEVELQFRYRFARYIEWRNRPNNPWRMETNYYYHLIGFRCTIYFSREIDLSQVSVYILRGVGPPEPLNNDKIKVYSPSGDGVWASEISSIDEWGNDSFTLPAGSWMLCYLEDEIDGLDFLSVRCASKPEERTKIDADIPISPFDSMPEFRGWGATRPPMKTTLPESFFED